MDEQYQEEGEEEVGRACCLVLHADLAQTSAAPAWPCLLCKRSETLGQAEKAWVQKGSDRSTAHVWLENHRNGVKEPFSLVLTTNFELRSYLAFQE